LYRDSRTTSANLEGHKWSREQTLGITALECHALFEWPLISRLNVTTACSYFYGFYIHLQKVTNKHFSPGLVHWLIFSKPLHTFSTFSPFLNFSTLSLLNLNTVFVFASFFEISLFELGNNHFFLQLPYLPFKRFLFRSRKISEIADFACQVFLRIWNVSRTFPLVLQSGLMETFFSSYTIFWQQQAVLRVVTH